jgi:malonyl-CoA O-methyltransferase
MILPLDYKTKLAGDFSASAGRYDHHAALQRQVAQNLAAGGTASSWQCLVLDAGMGTGILATLRPNTPIVGLDIAEGMCQQARALVPQSVVADMERIPLQNATCGGVFSSLALQWLPHPERFFAEAWRVCQPDGWLRVASFLPHTLYELRDAYQRAGLTPPVLDFADAATLQHQAMQAGWHSLTCREYTLTTTHPNLLALLKYLKALGARHKTQRGLHNRHDWQALQAAYPTASDSTIVASWQVLQLEAWR